MMRKTSFALIMTLLSMILLISSLASTSQAETAVSPHKIDRPDTLRIDLTAQWKQLGYTVNNATSISIALLNNVTRAYFAANPKAANCSLQITSQSKDLLTIISPTSASGQSGNVAPSPDTSIAPKACIIACAWTYPYAPYDLSNIQEEYNYLDCYASYYGNYQSYQDQLTNSQDTFAGIVAAVQTATSYTNVDFYMIGHGTTFQEWIIWPFYYVTVYCYCPYDGINADGSVNYNNCIWSTEFQSNTAPFNRDLSNVRLTMICACDSWGFESYALNPGGSNSHARAFVGANGMLMTNYDDLYMQRWVVDWYQYNWDSSSANADANSFAGNTYQPGVQFSYADTGSQVWC